MKHQLKTIILILSVLIIYSSNATEHGFIENKGQISNSNEKVLFYCQIGSTTYYICSNKLMIVQNKYEQIEENENNIFNHESKFCFSTYRTDLELENSNPHASISTDGLLDYTINIYKNGNTNGFNDIKIYKSISIENIYPDIDMRYYFTENGLKYDFICKPNTDPSRIKINTIGCDEVFLNRENELIINTPFYKILNKKPYSYQSDKRNISSSYLLDKNSISFKLEGYDKSQSLIIDPEINITNNILWSTYFGGNAIDWVRSVRIDKKNNVVLGGCSYSSNLPTTAGVVQKNNNGDLDFSITKFTNDGKLIWSTYFGGSYTDLLFFLDIYSSNEIVAGGDIRSVDFPITTDAFQKTYSGGTADCGYVKLTEDGKLIYATFIGGETFEGFDDGIVDKNDDVWMVGRSWSSAFPVTTNAYKGYKSGHYDAVLVKFSNKNKILYSSYWGGSNNEYAEGVAVDSQNNIAVSGYTDSDDYPVIGDVYQKTYKGNMDAFVCKMDTDGQPIWSGYYGGSSDDYGSNVAVDTKDNVIMSGITSSTNLPISPNGYQQSNAGGVDGFVVKFDKNGKIIWTTYIGGSNDEGLNNTLYDQGGAVRTDDKDNIIYCFRTQSNDIITTPDAYQTKFGGANDGLIAILDKDCNLLWSTYIGGSNEDIVEEVAISNTGNLYVAGITKSTDFPVVNAFQSKLSGDWDGFVMKFGINQPCANEPFSYPDFVNGRSIRYNGIAHKADSSIMLTDTRQYVVGTAWFDGLIPVDKGFSTRFSFRFSYGNNYNCQDGSLPGADGIAFLIQNAGTNAIGYPGGGLGYENIPNSLAIEFDTFSNDSTQIENYFDPNGNHVAVQSMKGNANTPKHNKTANIAMNSNIFPIISNGRIYYSQIDYSAEKKTLSVYLDTNKTLTNRVLYLQNFDLASYVSLNGGTKAVMGFTSATGCATQMHEIMSWDICLESSEPATDVKDNPQSKFFNVTPNPFDNEIKVYTNNKILKKVEVLDMMGRVILQSKPITDNSIILNTFELLSGVYFVRVFTENGYDTEKIIKY